jgi:hypothetical protein
LNCELGHDLRRTDIKTQFKRCRELLLLAEKTTRSILNQVAADETAHDVAKHRIQPCFQSDDASSAVVGLTAIILALF